jgi:hypothetical protein
LKIHLLDSSCGSVEKQSRLNYQNAAQVRGRKHWIRLGTGDMAPYEYTTHDWLRNIID